MAFPQCSLGWTASPGAEHLQGKCQVLVFSGILPSFPRTQFIYSWSAMKNTNMDKILTHLWESTFLSMWALPDCCPDRVTTVKYFHSEFFLQLFSNNPFSIPPPILFPHSPFLINVSEFSEPCWSCWISDCLLSPLTKHLTRFGYFKSMSAYAF